MQCSPIYNQNFISYQSISTHLYFSILLDVFLCIRFNFHNNLYARFGIKLNLTYSADLNTGKPNIISRLQTANIVEQCNDIHLPFKSFMQVTNNEYPCNEKDKSYENKTADNNGTPGFIHDLFNKIVIKKTLYSFIITAEHFIKASC